MNDHPNEAAERVAFTIAEFCVRNRVSDTLYYKLKSRGLGPAEMRLGAAVRISLDAELQWQRARATDARAATAAATASARGRQASEAAGQSAAHPGNVKRARRAARAAVAT